MALLDNRSLIKQFDPHNYLSHILEVPDQLIDGYVIGSEAIIPALYGQAKHVLILAVGESAPAALAVESLVAAYSRLPVMVCQDYVLPHWVSGDTLVIALDYSGTSEQVVMAFQEAAKRKARLLSISLGGDLIRESRRFRSPHITLTYGAPARVAFYHLLSVLIAVFRKLDLIDFREAMVTEAAVLCRSLIQNSGPEVAQYQNNAKQLAEKIALRRTLIVGSGPLTAIVKKWQTTLAATGRTVVVASTLSEFNDTIINGLGAIIKGVESPLVIMLQSKYDFSRNKLQQTLTYQVAQAKKIVYEQVFMHPSGSLFGEIVLAALLGDLVSYYLALLIGHDPTYLEATTFIRERLAQDIAAS